MLKVDDIEGELVRRVAGRVDGGTLLLLLLLRNHATKAAQQAAQKRATIATLKQRKSRPPFRREKCIYTLRGRSAVRGPRKSGILTTTTTTRDDITLRYLRLRARMRLRTRAGHERTMDDAPDAAVQR